MQIINKLGLGTAALGRPQYINIKQQSSEPFDISTFKLKGLELLEFAYEQGIRYFDTAPGYGMAEELILDWVNQKQDPNIEIASKWGYTYVANFDPNAKVHEVKDHSLSLLNKQWQVSQKLLPNLSTLQIHSATFETGVLQDKRVLDRLFQLKAQYQIRIGLTTTGSNQTEVLKAALDIAMDGTQLFDAFQVTYNVMDQSLSKMMHELDGKRVIIKEGLANGRIFRNVTYQKYDELYKLLENISSKYDVGVDAVALRFCMDSLAPFMVLSGASEKEQLVENLAVLNFELTEMEQQELKSLASDPTIYWDERKQLIWS